MWQQPSNSSKDLITSENKYVCILYLIESSSIYMIQLSGAANLDKGNNKDDMRVAMVGFSTSEDG